MRALRCPRTVIHEDVEQHSPEPKRAIHAMGAALLLITQTGTWPSNGQTADLQWREPKVRLGRLETRCPCRPLPMQIIATSSATVIPTRRATRAISEAQRRKQAAKPQSRPSRKYRPPQTLFQCPKLHKGQGYRRRSRRSNHKLPSALSISPSTN